MMNRFLLVAIISLFCSFNLNSQSCELPPHVYDAYLGDVVHLALVEMHKQNAPELDQVEVPMSWQEPIWNGLGAIFQDEGAERDSVFDIYCVHHYSCWGENYTSGRVGIFLEEGAPWESNWVSGDMTTNDVFLDSILTRHGFDEVQYFSLLEAFTIETDQHLNLEALATILEQHEYIESADPRGCGGDFSRISYLDEGDQQHFEFSVGWGDCPSGCIYRHYWEFSVDPENCMVLEKSIEGPIIDDPYDILEVNCNLTTATRSLEYKSRNVRAYPNPFVDKLWLDFENGVSYYELVNAVGVTLRSGEVNQAACLDIGNVESGFLTLLLFDASGKLLHVEKLVKN